MKMYGIPNCNIVKKAIDWMKANDLEVEFHDFKKKGISEEKLQEWSKEVGWEKLVNKKGTTWRTLSPEAQQQVTNEKAAIALMITKPSLIKRPVIEAERQLLVGFDEEQYINTLKQK
jgi:arsenate reductase